MGFAKALWGGAGVVLAAVLGEWSAPRWLRWCGRQLRVAAGAVRARPGRSAAVLAGLIALGVGADQAYRWWQAQPRPVEVSLAVTDPALTDFANEGLPQPVVVRFSESVAPLAGVGKPVTAGIRVTPAVAGEWQWQDDRTLVFSPSGEWPVGTRYEGVLDRSAVAPQVRLQSTAFSFTSAGFRAEVRRAEFYQDPVNPTVKKAVIEVGFSHPVNVAEFEKRIELRLAGQADGVLGIGRETTASTVSYDKLKLSAYVHSAVLPIPKESTTLNLAVDRGVVAQAGGEGSTEPLTATVAVPGLYGLSVTDVGTTIVTNERFEPEQVLLINTSQRVHENDLARQVSAWVLPLHKLPPTPTPTPSAPQEPHAWSDTREITAEVLARSEKLVLSPIAAAQEHTDTHSFKLKADVGRVVYVQIEPKAQSFGGYLMRSRDQRLITMPPYPPELRILSQGALLPMSGEKKLAVLVRDLPGLRVEVGRVQPSQLQHLVSQARGSYGNPDFLGSFGADNLIDRFERTVPLSLPPGQAHYESIDLSEYFAKDGETRRGLFLLKVQGFDPQAAESAGSGSETADEDAGQQEDGEMEDTGEEGDHADPAAQEERRLVLVTDLGIVVKQSTDGSRDVFVQSLFTGLPVPGVTVDIVAKNGSTLFSQVTDAAGRVHFDKLDGLVRERAPLLLLARKAGDMSFMPLNRDDRTLDVSRFDVGGVQSARTADQLNAYLFSDRGIYRPGETLRIGMIVKAADWAQSLAGVPLEAEVLDARGLTVKRERIALVAGGFAELAHTTLESSPTGNYTVNLHIVASDKSLRQIGSTTVKVQEFLPDRMKVTARLSTMAPDGWVHPRELKGLVNAQNLFGTPAENRRVEVSMALNPAWPAFRSHPDHVFYDPLRATQGVTDTLPEAVTDAQGEAVLELGLQRFDKATYRLNLLAKVFEPEGGRHVAADVSALVSELPYLVGVKHDGDLGFVSLGSTRRSEIIAIDPQARKTAVSNLKLQWVERQTVSVLMRQPDDTYRFESRRKDKLLSEAPLTLAATGHMLALDTSKAGNFSYVVRDTAGLELNRIDYSVAGQGNVTRSLERNAELQLTLNKKDYAPGEEIEVSIRAPYVGAGMITIERDKVFAQTWFKTTTTASVQKIRLPKDFEGNGYVSVQFVRDPASDEIFTSPLSHGVVPFATSLAQRTQALTLSVPERTRPGQTLKMKLTAAQATRVVVFAVDEGILQVARYQNADPLGHFFQKRALEVKTSQILDLLLPEFKRLMAASAPGGDEAGASARFLNPFKRKGEAPAVYWSGIVDVKGDKEFSYVVPDHFNGSLRVMAVAVNDASVGVAQAQAQVRGDFVISPNLPLMVSPGDVFDVSVGVSNNIASAPPNAPVQLALKVPPAFEVLGPAQQTLPIGPLREGVATYRLKVKDTQAAPLGSATLEFSTALGTASARRRMDISVRPAMPRTTTVALGRFTGSTEVAVTRDLLPEFRRQEVAVSALPLALAPGLMSYLDGFPHQCTEQLTSRVLPALVLARRPEFGASTPQATGKAFGEAVRILRSRQNAQGGFGLWSASVEADEFASVYAVHMLMEAQALGMADVQVPADLLGRGLGYLQQLAATPPTDLGDARNRAYAIYLLTRNGAVTTPLVASLRESLDAQFGATWRTTSTAAYLAATYQLLKQDKPARELMVALVRQLEKGGATYRWSDYDDPQVRDAQTLYLLARHFPAQLAALDAGTMGRFVAPLAQGSFNTLSSAYSVLALEAMARNLEAGALGTLSVTQVDAKGVATPLPLPANLLPRAAFAAGTAQLRLANDPGRATYYAVTQSGFDRAPATTELKSGMEVLREYVGADGKPLSAVKVGDEVTVRLSLRALVPAGAAAASVRIDSVAMTDLLPGGFEPVQSRDENGAATTVTGPALEFADVREDRVVLYVSATADVQTYSFRIRATNVGEFGVPPAHAESMYDRTLLARSLSSRLVVTSARKP